MLRPEDRGERPVRRGGEEIDDVAELAVDRGGIGEHADAEPIQARGGEQPFGAEQHGSGGVTRKGGQAREIRLRHWASPDFKVLLYSRSRRV